jgi:hypothetical protein
VEVSSERKGDKNGDFGGGVGVSGVGVVAGVGIAGVGVGVSGVAGVRIGKVGIGTGFKTVSMISSVSLLLTPFLSLSLSLLRVLFPRQLLLFLSP